jgi:hypothetical protein
MGDLRLLGCEGVARVQGALARGLAGGRELATGAFSEPVGPDAAERVVGGSKLFARVDAPVLATKPFAVHELGAGQVRVEAAASQPLDRLLVEGFGGGADVHARYFGAELDDQSLTPGDNPRIAPTRFADWLGQSTATQPNPNVPQPEGGTQS